MIKISTCDFSFPRLQWEQALRLVHDLGMQGVDIGLFGGDRSHLNPGEVLSNPHRAASRINSAVAGNDLEISDVFAQQGRVEEENAINHPDARVRQESAEYFHRVLEFALRCNAKHLTLLPGIYFEGEAHEDSLKRAAEELTWRSDFAKKTGVTLGIEPHLGSVAPTPATAKQLFLFAPGLTCTLDYSHFACQGFRDEEIEPLLSSSKHFHARAACKERLQASLRENTINFGGIVRQMNRSGYDGFIAIEYVWIQRMRLDEVDTLSETILMRDLLRSAAGDA